MSKSTHKPNCKTCNTRSTVPGGSDVGEDSIVERIRAKKSALSVMEFATIMGTGKAKIYRMVKAGRIPAIQFGDAIKFDPKVIADWLEERTIAA